MSNLRPRYDIAVIGGGPAGSTLATLLAKAGRDVVLFEKDTFPRDKLCGEFLSPESQHILRELGLLERVASGAPEIRSARFSAPSGAEVHARLPDAALGVTRLRLDAALFDAAGDAGAQICSGHTVTDIIPGVGGSALQVRADGATTRVGARVVVCTYGRRTRLDRVQGRKFMERQHPFVGFKRHHRPAPGADGQRLDDELSGVVEIHGFEGGYCGMSHVETGEVNVCMLLEQRFLDGIDRPTWPDIVGAISGENRRLRARLTALEPSEDTMHAVAQVPFERKNVFERGVFFCGDAAGMIAPLTGDGQAMAMESAHLLATTLSRLPARIHTGHVMSAGQRWTRAWRQRYAMRMQLGRKLQWLLFRRLPLEVGVRAVSAVPGLADALARWTRSS